MERVKEQLSMAWFGRSVSVAKVANQCVCCGKPANKFRDKLSQKEYQISGFCQLCQDKTFVNDEENN